MPKRTRGAALFLLISGLALAQHPAPASDPLQGLLSEERPAEQNIRLHVSLLRVPMHEASAAILADSGGDLAFWRTRLTEWRQAGQLQLVTEWTTNAEDGREHSPTRARAFRFLSQGAATHFWFQRQCAESQNSPPPDPNDLLQDLSEDKVGDEFKATLTMRKGWQQAHLKLAMLHCPEPRTRPTNTWPLPFLTAPRYLFRPWRLEVNTVCPVDHPFLLGCQMEPPQDGQLHTGHVLMAFGRIVLPGKNGRELAAELSDIDPLHHVQSWTLAIDRNLFLPWLLDRHSADRDDDALQTWLKKAAGNDGIELLATAAAAVRESAPHSYSDPKGPLRSEVVATLRWQDAAGFEPGGTPSIFRPLSCEDETYFLEHTLAVELANVAPAGFVPDPLARAPNPPKSNRWSLYFQTGRPGAAATWKKWKFAMEHASDDPAALEIAESDSHRPSESGQASFTVTAGRAVLAHASLTPKGRIHATFCRLIENTGARIPPAPVEAAVKSSGTTTVLGIDTPVSWQNRLLGDTDLNFQSLAEDLLAAVGDGKARVASLDAVTQMIEGGGEVAATTPVIFPGGGYVNTAGTPNGIYFNMREIGRESVGDRMEANTFEDILTCSLHTVGSAEWRHWGMWQPALKNMTTPALAGIDLPAFPVIRFAQRSLTIPNRPQVIAVIRQSEVFSPAKSAAPSLRWYIARRDGDSPQPPPGSSFAFSSESPRTLQALVIKIPPDHRLPEDPELAAQQLLEQIRQGAASVLDLITLRRSGNRKVSAETGWDLHFTNGRDAPHEMSKVLKAPAVMPPCTRFGDHVDIANHVVGFHIEFEAGEWKMSRDAEAPQIVTDSFPDTRLEWATAEVKTATINVQRPIFTIHEAQGGLPPPGKATLSRLSADTMLLLRNLN